MNAFENMKYGLFVHLVAAITPRVDGSVPETADEIAKEFDVTAFAESVKRMGVQYLILTAWHYRMRPLYPSAVTERYRPGNSCSRDLLGEIIDAANERGVSVILYTHPRDGHDLEGRERIDTGWGEGFEEGRPDTPDPAKFDCEKWNGYVLDLYRELAERYGKKIIGFYTDGVGPVRGRDPVMTKNRLIVDYTAIRDIMKSANEDLVMIQNYFGYLFSDDIGMPEAYFRYERKIGFDPARLPAPSGCIAVCPFEGGWWPRQEARGKDARLMKPEDIALYTLFAASSSPAGGVSWASGPYSDGASWPVGVTQTMEEAGRLLETYREYCFDAAPGRAWGALPGDTLSSLGGVFSTASRDKKTEYLFVTGLSGKTVKLSPAADGCLLTDPKVMTGDIAVESFFRTEDGYELTLSGDIGALPAVIAFRRSEATLESEWINDTDKRIRYEGSWKYVHLTEADQSSLGCYDSDMRAASEKGDRAFIAFEGDRVSVYGCARPEGGRAAVFIDGVLSGYADCGGETENRKRLFTSRDLHGGIHTLYLELISDAPFMLDAVRIDRKP